MPLSITVSGEAAIPKIAERAVLHVTVYAEGESKAWVTEQVTTSAAHLRQMLSSLSEEVVAHWSMKSLRTQRWTDDKGTKFSSEVSFDIRFKDFTVLGPFATRLSASPNVRIGAVAWILTEETRKAHAQQLRRMAAEDALSRARDYAEAFGLTQVRPVEVNEGAVQSLAPPGHHAFGSQAVSRSAFGRSTNEDLPPDTDFAFQPDEIKMQSSVNCRFEAE